MGDGGLYIMWAGLMLILDLIVLVVSTRVNSGERRVARKEAHNPQCELIQKKEKKD